MKFYCFTFADGYRCICAGFSKVEKAHEEARHGKIISKVRV